MNKKMLLGSVSAVMLASAPAMAGDFHALSSLQGATPVALQDNVLATMEGGAFCDATMADSDGGVALCAFLNPGASSGTAAFTVANELPVTAAQFLQVVN